METKRTFKYANLHLWTDVEPYEIIRYVSDVTLELRHMKSELLSKPEFIPGGFSAHCTNNSSLKYKITPDPDAEIIRARLRKDGKFHSVKGEHHLSDRPMKYYDYNF